MPVQYLIVGNSIAQQKINCISAAWNSSVWVHCMTTHYLNVTHDLKWSVFLNKMSEVALVYLFHVRYAIPPKTGWQHVGYISVFITEDDSLITDHQYNNDILIT